MSKLLILFIGIFLNVFSLDDLTEDQPEVRKQNAIRDPINTILSRLKELKSREALKYVTLKWSDILSHNSGHITLKSENDNNESDLIIFLNNILPDGFKVKSSDVYSAIDSRKFIKRTYWSLIKRKLEQRNIYIESENLAFILTNVTVTNGNGDALVLAKKHSSFFGFFGKDEYVDLSSLANINNDQPKIYHKEDHELYEKAIAEEESTIEMFCHIAFIVQHSSEENSNKEIYDIQEKFLNDILPDGFRVKSKNIFLYKEEQNEKIRKLVLKNNINEILELITKVNLDTILNKLRAKLQLIVADTKKQVTFDEWGNEDNLEIREPAEQTGKQIGPKDELTIKKLLISILLGIDIRDAENNQLITVELPTKEHPKYYNLSQRGVVLTSNTKEYIDKIKQFFLFEGSISSMRKEKFQSNLL